MEHIMSLARSLSIAALLLASLAPHAALAGSLSATTSSSTLTFRPPTLVNPTLPPGTTNTLNPQPLPPRTFGSSVMLNPQPLPPRNFGR
jgi:hypothetical protein